MASRPSSRGSGDSGTVPLLLRRLCCKVTGLSEEEAQPVIQRAYTILGSNFGSPVESDEVQVSEKIRRRLVRRGREKDAATFEELHRKLQTQGILKNRWAMLYLLMSLSESESKSARETSGAYFGRGLPNFATSTPFHPGMVGRHGQVTDRSSPDRSRTPGSLGTTSSSGISSIHSDVRSNDPTPVPQSFLPSTTYVSVDREKTGKHASRLAGAISKQDPGSNTALVAKGGRGHSGGMIKVQGGESHFEIPEIELVKDLVYVFQGIEGKWIKYDPSRDGYKIDNQAGVPKAKRQLVSKLAECGWLYNKVKNYVENRSADKTFGLVGQSFCSALHQELTEYYRLIAVLESQLQEDVDQGIGLNVCTVTLRRLVVWTFDPLIRLKTLAALVDVCKGKKGGALTSAIFSYMQHGDPFVKSLIKHILTMVAQPIYATLLRWIYDGELEDTHDEFFVAADPTVKNDRLWHDKYSLRKSMIPTFISTDQARKILLTGKSINFLRQVCLDRTPIKGSDGTKCTDMSLAEWMFTQDLSNNFQDMIDQVYKETSKHLLDILHTKYKFMDHLKFSNNFQDMIDQVFKGTSKHLLDILHTKYKFMDHLKAMRRYLLLGQGDFIRHLMDLLEEDLAKPASNLYLHNLTGILETAIRATNAQFDDTDILKRVDVRLLEVSPGDSHWDVFSLDYHVVSPGDTGWDVFSLDYHVDGPIRTVFTPECMIMYLRVFNFLWRAKRMEYVLSLIWRNQIFNAKLLRVVPELSKILQQCHKLSSEMVHFIQQTQYYISFEVLECSWHELLGKVREAEDLDCVIAAHETFLDTIITKCLQDVLECSWHELLGKVREAEDLDCVIAAHETFLDTIITRCLLDEQSRGILTQLRTIFDLIIDFQQAQDSFYQTAQHELNARQHYAKLQQQKTDQGEWGVTEEMEEEERKRRVDFLKTVIPSTRAKFAVLAQSYQDMVQQFLVMVTSHQDVSLRFLSFRLDFNEHYKGKEPKLHSPSTYQRVKKIT